MDILDQAQIFEARERSMAVAAAQAALPTGPGRAFCAHCDEPIPEGRRLAMPGCTLCRECQTEMEPRR